MASGSGRHAAADGSFGRSTGASVLRGAGLLLVAVIIGIVLLQANDDGDQFDRPVVAGSHTTTSVPATTVPPTTTTPTTAPVRPPAQVKVLTANGTNVGGLAGAFKDRLRAAGYNTLAPTDTTKKGVAASAVYVTPGFEAEARVVAETIGIPVTQVKPLPNPPPVVNIQGANVVVVIGQDKAATVTTTTRRSGTTATTTRARTSTTVAGGGTTTSPSRSRAATTTTKP